MTDPAIANVAIRGARSSDVTQIAELVGTLGYPSSEEAVAQRLARLATRDRDVVLVANLDDGVIAGWIHGSELDLLEAGRRCEILGLVVAPVFRKHGIGRALVVAVEEWAIDRGLALVSVRSNLVRPDAHPFYERLGFTKVKTQHVYRKALMIDDR